MSRAPLPPRIATALAVILIALVTLGIDRLEHARLNEQTQREVLSALSEVRGRLEGALTADLGLLRGVAAHAAVHPELSQDEFARLAAELVQGSRHIVNIALARGDKISHIYPATGNQGAIGLDLTTWPVQRDAIAVMRAEHRVVTIGPVELVQGGRAVIGHAPVFADGAYWGLVAMPIDLDRLFGDAGLTDLANKVDVAVRGESMKGAGYLAIYGDQTVFGRDAVIEPVEFLSGTWTLAGAPKAGWAAAAPSLWGIRLGGLALAVVVGFLVARLQRAVGHIHVMALHDSLTGLPNRALLSDRLSQQIAKAQRYDEVFVVMAIDLDDFKPINDTFGHAAGDEALIEIAGRLERSLRASDTVARVGGDEFVVILPEADTPDAAAAVATKMIDTFDEPLMVEGHKMMLGLSIGIAFFPTDGGEATDLVGRADGAMYQAKAAGKNRFHFASAERLDELTRAADRAMPGSKSD